MPTIEEQLQKKKPFKKKEYRSYLSLNETLSDLDQNNSAKQGDIPNKNQDITHDIVVESPTMGEMPIRDDLTTMDKTPIVGDSTTTNKKVPKTKASRATGFTQVPHEVIEILFSHDLGDRKLRVLLLIIRETLGWHKELTALSAKDFRDALGYDNSTLWKILRPLIKDGYLRCESPGGGSKNWYGLNPKKFGALLAEKVVGNSTTVNLTTMGVLPTTYVGDLTTGGSGQNTHTPPYRNIGSKYNSNISLSLEEIFESYFSEIRAPLAAKQEREAFLEIRNRNPDLSDTELLECFELISKDRDAKGNPITFKFVWMAKGLDKLLDRARGSLQEKARKTLTVTEAQEEARLKAEFQAKQTAEEASMSADEISKMIAESLTGFRSRTQKRIASGEMTEEELQKRREFLKEQARLLNAQKNENQGL